MSSLRANVLQSLEGSHIALQGIVIALFALFITSKALGYRRGLKVCGHGKVMLLTKLSCLTKNRYEGGEQPPRNPRTLPSHQPTWCPVSCNVVEPQPEIRLELAR